MWPRRYALAVCALLAAQGSGAAQEARFRNVAEQRRAKGNRLYGQGLYQEALQSYQAAYDLYPDPRYLFNIALAREKTFDYEGCAVAFRRFLDQARDVGADVRAQAEERLAACRDRAQVPVRFTSAPTNAAVYLGEGEARALKGRTPQELALGPGTYVVTMELAGYVPHKDTLQVRPGERPQVDFVLEKLSSLRIEADPGGARVQIDDLDWEAAPAVRQIQAGAHRVQVVKEGYEPTSREVKVEPGQEVSLVLSLRPLPTIRNLRLATRVPIAGVSVRVDGKPAPPPPLTLDIGPGSHRLEMHAPGHLPFAGDIAVPEDRDLKLVARLAPVRSRRSRVVFWSLAGSAGAAAVAGGVLGLLALADQSDFDADPTPGLGDRGERRAEAADACFVTAAVLAGSSVLWWWLTAPSSSRVAIEY